MQNSKREIPPQLAEPLNHKHYLLKQIFKYLVEPEIVLVVRFA